MSASFSIEMRDEETSMNGHRHKVSGARLATLGARGLIVAALALLAAGCNKTTATSETIDTVPSDYRARHPIALKEGRHSLALHVGPGRGGLSPVQRAEVLAFAQNWKRDATGGVTVDRPTGGPNERAALDTLKEVLSIIQQAGVPNEGIGIRPYESNGRRIAPLRLNYPQVVAEAGPCGLWPDDLGPTYERKHFENQQYWNFGCATQRNLAAMVAEPTDLVQPRSETPAYRAKRTFGNDKWRKGENPATVYSDQKGAISDLGK
jgi:pilus assembly protein CpaD